MSVPYSSILAVSVALFALGGCGQIDREQGGPWELEADASPPSARISLDGGAWSSSEDGTVTPASQTDAGSRTAADTSSGCPRLQVAVPAGKHLYVRSSPDTSASTLGRLSRGKIVEVLAAVVGERLEGNSTWYRIRTATLEGYVWSGLTTCTSAG